MKDKKLIEICKKLIRYRHDNSIFYHFDKYLKITKVKIKSFDIVNQVDGEDIYRVKYKFGLNLWNPISWIVVVLLFFIYIVNGIKEFIGEFDVSLDEYSELYKIKY